MNWNIFVLRELFQRKSKLITSSLAIVLGIAAIVSISTITTYSEESVAKELDALGANVLILPPEVSVADYYSADFQNGELPEEYVTLIAMSNVEGVDNMSPKLTLPTDIKGNRVILTGILPKSEFQNKTSWQGAGIFSRPKICGSAEDVFKMNQKLPQETLARKRVITNLEHHEVLVGADIAKKLHLKEGAEIAMLDSPFKVLAVLPTTGTIDDSRIFAHLHTVQALTDKDALLSAIEVVGCCKQVSKGLISNLQSLLPEANIVTIAHIVDTQVKTNALMRNLSYLLLMIIVIMGGASIGNDMYNNVYERRKEIGILIALGATPKIILKVFIKKAALLGLLGGISGYIIGTVLALALGPLIAGVHVFPILYLSIIAVVLSICIAIGASYFPARYASRLEPSIALQEN